MNRAVVATLVLPSQREQVIVPYPATLVAEPVATLCRSTLLVTSQTALKQHGYYEAYARALAPKDAAAIASSAAGMWLPIEVGLEHYRACDSLDLPTSEQLKLGGEVVHALQRTFIGSALKVASSGAGIGPLAGLAKFATVYSRSIKGGGVRVLRLGPKDARVDFVGLPYAKIRYFRVAYRGFIQAGCEFFTHRVHVAELGAWGSAMTLAYRIAWV
jgi:hypothetical protein